MEAVFSSAPSAIASFVRMTSLNTKPVAKSWKRRHSSACYCDDHVRRKGFKYERNQPMPCPKCGFETQQTKDLSMSTRHHNYGRQQIRDDDDDDYGSSSGYGGSGYGYYGSGGGAGDVDENDDEDDDDDDEDDDEDEDDDSDEESEEDDEKEGEKEDTTESKE
ncbi:hypothetical protein HPB50_024044 [Hyalomma asiaticum]|uniref:Uncharacterized protein n=1 Tax=Hyalomma asiaticum TaxID=266040 RepID=A0ACB7SS49_HYAAI|nr:hypothetical protein HPB50_024044 [Hyalomma asiaticum]